MNGCEKLWVWGLFPLLFLCFAGILFFEVRDIQYWAEKFGFLDTGSEDVELTLSEKSVPELVLYSVFILRIFFEPVLALTSLTWYTIAFCYFAKTDNLEFYYEEKYGGCWSWSNLHNLKEQSHDPEVRSTMVALHVAPPDPEPPEVPAQVGGMCTFTEVHHGTSESEVNSDRLQQENDTGAPVYTWCVPDKERAKFPKRVPNRECSQGHWDLKDPINVLHPMHSSQPEGSEWIEQMSLNRLLQKGLPEIRIAYEKCARLASANLRLAITRFRTIDEELDR